jgi:release factor glutamine methyltransferase
MLTDSLEKSPIDSIVREARRRLSSSSSAILDAELIMAHVLNCDRAGVYRNGKCVLDRKQNEHYQALVNERLQGKPVAQIIGVKEFWSLPFVVNEHVLIPRPETELLVEAALSLVSDEVNPLIADLGTGCGAIAVSISRERPDATVVAVEKSAAALIVAAHNCVTHAGSKIALVKGNWSAALTPRTFNLIVSNPPYICSGDPALLESDIRFEPPTALAAGRDGFTELRAIIESAGNALVPGGKLALEHGYNQAAGVRDLLTKNGFVQIATQRDLAGHERITHGACNRA